ncbi:hypothetical protein BC938DRAFT_476945, partial [Jimgerdemannia flammicorona]
MNNLKYSTFGVLLECLPSTYHGRACFVSQHKVLWEVGWHAKLMAALFQVYWRLRMTDIQQQEVPENTTMSKYCQMLSKSIGVVWRVLGISAVEGIMAERLDVSTRSIGRESWQRHLAALLRD